MLRAGSDAGGNRGRALAIAAEKVRHGSSYIEHRPMKPFAPDLESADRWEAWKPVSTIMQTNVPRVSVGCSRESLLAIFGGLGVETALVVDPDGHAVGLVSRGR